MQGVIRSILLALVFAASAAAQTAPATARTAPDWLRDGLVYEIFPRAFSPRGDLDGVTAQLDRLKDLGVTVVWLMPNHPMGTEKAKGSLGCPYAVRDFVACGPAYGCPRCGWWRCH